MLCCHRSIQQTLTISQYVTAISECAFGDHRGNELKSDCSTEAANLFQGCADMGVQLPVWSLAICWQALHVPSFPQCIRYTIRIWSIVCEITAEEVK